MEKYGLRSRIRLGTEVVGIAWDEGLKLWQVSTGSGEVLATRNVVSATGVLTKPKYPDIPGLESFAGQRMHTARWDHGVSLRDKRVAVIGTGASALQVIPEIAPEVSHLTVFQRTPIWVLPKPDTVVPGAAKSLMARLPLLQGAARLASQAMVEATFVLAAHYDRYLHVAKFFERVGLDYLERAVADPETRDKLTPRYGLGCKRPSMSNTYLQAFNRPNVALETCGVESIEPAGIRTRDGRLHEVDVLVCATGFKVFESGNMPPFPVTGTGSRDLDAWWETNRYQAYEGVSVPGFPNYFMVLGPNGYNGASYFQLIEMQTRHIVRCLSAARRAGATRIEVKPEANERYFRDMLARRPNQVFFRSNCGSANSYYFDRHGDVPFRPATSIEAHLRSRFFALDDYAFS